MMKKLTPFLCIVVFLFCLPVQAEQRFFHEKQICSLAPTAQDNKAVQIIQVAAEASSFEKRFLLPKPSTQAERRGCCSWHGGVCGCSGGRAVCCDGQLSPSCGCD